MTLRPVTAEQVMIKMKQVWPEACHYPIEWECRFIAGLVNKWVDATNAKKATNPSDAAIKRAHRDYLLMAKHARAFAKIGGRVMDDLGQRRLVVKRPPEAENMPAEVWQAIVGNEDLRPDISAALAAIEAAKLAVEKIPERRPEELQDREPIKLIGEWVCRFWTATGSNVSLSAKKDGRLTRFVCCVMKATGFTISADTASEYLRGRTGRPRSGKSKPAS